MIDKKKALFLPLLAGLFVVSCDSKARLAEDIEGAWTSTPEQLQSSPGSQSTLVRVLDFRRESGGAEGTVTVKALVTVDNVVGGDNVAEAPMSVTASGVATITGQYQAEDDDDLLITLDYTTMSVSVDPQGVMLSVNPLTNGESPDVETLKPAAVNLATQQVTRAAQTAFSNVAKIEDIKISKNLMSCEIGHKDLTFRKTAN